MKPLSRALACLLSVCSLIGLGVAAAPAASASACGGVVWTRGAVGFGVEASPSGVYVCFDVAGVRRVLEVSNVSVVEVHDTFTCTNPVTGTVGDPNDPPYVEYRVAYDPANSAICVGVDSFARSVVVEVDGPPQVAFYTPGPYPSPACGEDGVRQDAGVFGEGYGLPSEYVLAGAGGDTLETFDLCLGARGVVECDVLGPDGNVVTSPAMCPAATALADEIEARVAQALATVNGTVATATAIVNGVVAQVRSVVDPLVATALAEAARAVQVVQGVADMLPARIHPTMGNCSVSVTSVSSPAVEVRRSPTGQVPASVCVVTANGVTRVTVG